MKKPSSSKRKSKAKPGKKPAVRVKRRPGKRRPIMRHSREG
ncbi:MAG: hypothetical protein WEB59_04315 [Thermoanaerobaculia bacterium]